MNTDNYVLAARENVLSRRMPDEELGYAVNDRRPALAGSEQGTPAALPQAPTRTTSILRGVPSALSGCWW